MKKLIFMTLIAAASLAGCFPRASYVQQALLPTGAHKFGGDVAVVDRPAASSTVTVAVGEPLIVSGKDRVTYHVESVAPSIAEGEYTLYGEKDFRVAVKLPAGRFPVESENMYGERFAYAGLAPADWAYKGKFDSTSTVAAFYRIKKDGSIDAAWTQDGDPTPVYMDVPGLAGKVSIKSTSTPDASFLRRELLYTGRNGGHLTILYREYINDTARPAFSQQLQYDISNDPVIGYQGAHFRVIEANNTSITYEVLSTMSAPR